MSLSPNDIGEGKRVQQVTISPISSEILAVRIRQVTTELKEDDIPKPSTTFQPIRRSSGAQNVGYSKSAITDKRRASSGSSQTVRKEGKSGSSKSKIPDSRYSKSNMTDKPKSLPSSSETAQKGGKQSSIDTDPESPPCLKHAALNISRKASDVPAEKIKLCNDCSKSMLSYIFLVQDFLDSLAKEISGEGTSQCLQCARQEVRDSLASLGDDYGIRKGDAYKGGNKSNSECSQIQIDSKSKDDSNNRAINKRTSRTRNRQEYKRNEGFHYDASSPEVLHPTQQINFLYNVSPPNDAQQTKVENLSSNNKHVDQSCSEDYIPYQQKTASNSQNPSQQIVSPLQNLSQENSLHSQMPHQQPTEAFYQNYNQQQTAADYPGKDESHDSSHSSVIKSNASNIFQSRQQNEESSAKPMFLPTMERVQPNYDMPAKPESRNENDPNNNILAQHTPSLSSDHVDGIISTLSNAEREIYDTARNGAGWESLTEPQERLGSSSSHVLSTEAFVTSCRNNAEAIGCLVLGTSLLLCRTSRTLCVLVSDGVSTAFRSALSAVFQVVQNVRSLDTLGTTKLSLLEQPELGITFDKLNVWRLTQFRKCVYLNPDTLVIQNCDELFCHEELSAVPDIGWPDCFNSGVFVFSPSVDTFWKLMEFSEKQGSYDGGDQGLLNSYFHSWSSDISNKLSFIYNLMANVSYTYTPAFKQFGRNVKIVQFHGSFKPWHVKFFTNSGQISPSSPVHSTYVQFVHIWLNIFRISVLRLMSQEIQSYSASQETICAVEILRYFPLPSESEAAFFLTPPSVRVRLAEKKLSRSPSLPISEAQRRKSAEFLRYANPEDESVPEKTSSRQSEESTKKTTETADVTKSEVSESDEHPKDKPEETTLETDEVFMENVAGATKVIDENTLPGAEVGDYQGMKAWEQGRIDYEGTDSSDNVIKRLQFLMSRPK